MLAAGLFGAFEYHAVLQAGRQVDRVTFLAGSKSKQCLIHCAVRGLIGTAYDNPVELGITQC